MTGREMLLATLQCQPVERVPWLPFTGCHAGQLIQSPADKFLRNADQIVAGVTTAARRYRADGVPVCFDLQVEAEALGCSLSWAPNNPPAVSSHVLDERPLSELRVPGVGDGRISVMFDAARRLRQSLPDLALFGLVTGPFTLAMHLAGPSLFIQMYDDPAAVLQLHDFCRRVAERMISGYLAAGCDVIAVVDPMTSQIGPEQFAEFVAPSASALFAFIREQRALGSFFVCGHAQKNIEVMCDCRPDNVCVDENIALAYVREQCLRRGISFGGNLRLTSVLLLGTPEDAAAHAAECLDLGGGHGYVLAPGCDLPYDTPPANLEAVAEVVHDAYRRQVARELAAARKEDATLRFDLSDYGRSDQVIVDVITLDSESCAPCQYMVESVRDVVPLFGDLVIWREHKIKHRAGLEFMTSMMVRNVPTICIDGQIRFVSRIPPRQELIAAIQARINEKLQLKIRHRRARVTILGDTGEASANAVRNVRQAIEELGIDVEVELIEDDNLLRTYGAEGKPAVVLARYQLKSAGLVPEVRIVKEWLKDL